MTAELGKGVNHISAEGFFLDESGAAESVEVFACGLICDSDAIANLVKSEARMLGKELEDLDAAVVGHALHNPLSDGVLFFVHGGFNWPNEEKLRSLGDLFSLSGGNPSGGLRSSRQGFGNGYKGIGKAWLK